MCKLTMTGMPVNKPSDTKVMGGKKRPQVTGSSKSGCITELGPGTDLRRPKPHKDPSVPEPNLVVAVTCCEDVTATTSLERGHVTWCRGSHIFSITAYMHQNQHFMVKQCFYYFASLSLNAN